MIELKHGEGTIARRIPAMLRMFGKYGIDLRKQPILVYPTLHYQNGGLDINPDCQTPAVPGLFVAGGSGGRHPRPQPPDGQQLIGHYRLRPGCRPECRADGRHGPGPG